MKQIVGLTISACVIKWWYLYACGMKQCVWPV